MLLKEDQVGHIQEGLVGRVEWYGMVLQEKEKQLEALRKKEIFVEQIEAQAAELEEIRSAAKRGSGRRCTGGCVGSVGVGWALQEKSNSWKCSESSWRSLQRKWRHKLK